MQVFTQSRRVGGFNRSNAGQTHLARVTWGLCVHMESEWQDDMYLEVLLTNNVKLFVSWVSAWLKHLTFSLKDSKL